MNLLTMAPGSAVAVGVRVAAGDALGLAVAEKVGEGLGVMTAEGVGVDATAGVVGDAVGETGPTVGVVVAEDTVGGGVEARPQPASKMATVSARAHS
jgi:hypothetical protein